MPPPVDTVFLIADALLSSIITTYAAEGVSLPSKQFVSDGHPIAFDCELLAVSVARTYRGTASIDTPPVFPQRCVAIRSAEYHVWLIRCTSKPQDSGDPPTTTTIESYARPILTDSWLLPYGLSLAASSGDLVAPCDSIRLDECIVQEPRGGFGGVDLTLTVQLGDG